MKNPGETHVLGAHLVFYRCAPLLRTLFFVGAHQRYAPCFLQVRTLPHLKSPNSPLILMGGYVNMGCLKTSLRMANFDCFRKFCNQ
jgi:hypothetical protein